MLESEPLSTIADVLKWLPEEDAEREHPGHESIRAFIERAYAFADHAHAGQKRKSNAPYITHPLAVAELLAEMHFDPAVIAAGLLHDVIEDCDVTAQNIADEFGREVMTLVEGVTKLEQVEQEVKEESKRDRDIRDLESLRKLLLAMANDDIRVIFIKLADRLHNMRTLEYLSPHARIRMARETLEIFAPLANRLGIWVWKAELEDRSFLYLNEPMYHRLDELLDARNDERENRVKARISQLKDLLAQNHINGEIKGRPKHIYSIYSKMRRKNAPFARIYDTEGLRVIVDTEAECYQVLGLVHQMWTPVAGEFDDYIANPKSNGYQSLHTAVIGKDGTAMEIQIRTRDMHSLAEYGVAAHWRYKERGVPLSNQAMDQISSIRQNVQELTEDANDARTFVDSVRLDMFQDRVFVFTPKGKVIDLPLGATPLDFAYRVHTEVGHGCRGARVNGRWTNLDYELETGDQVEIILGRKGGPSRNWLSEELGFLKTSRARQKIRQWFRRQSRDENAARGREMLERILKRLSLKLSVEEVADQFKRRFTTNVEFLAALGMGDISSDAIVSKLEQYILQNEHQEDDDYPEVDEEPVPPAPAIETDTISIHGTGGILTQIAQCCKPLPGEEIIGFITRGRGITIHRRDCPNVLSMTMNDQDRLIEVEWGGAEKHTFPVQIVVTAYDRSGLIHDVSGVVADLDINLGAVSTGRRDRYNIIKVYMTLEVPDLTMLTRVLSRIEQLNNIIDAHRAV